MTVVGRRLAENGQQPMDANSVPSLFMENLPETPPDSIAGAAVLKMKFDEAPRQIFRSCCSQMHGGHDFSEGMHVRANGAE